jgi:hypothetical protein
LRAPAAHLRRHFCGRQFEHLGAARRGQFGERARRVVVGLAPLVVVLPIAVAVALVLLGELLEPRFGHEAQRPPRARQRVAPVPEDEVPLAVFALHLNEHRVRAQVPQRAVPVGPRVVALLEPVGEHEARLPVRGAGVESGLEVVFGGHAVIRLVRVPIRV